MVIRPVPATESFQCSATLLLRLFKLRLTFDEMVR